MQKRIVFVVGHTNWGKSRTLRGLGEICISRRTYIAIKGTEFKVRNMSNDDRPQAKPDSYFEFMDSTTLKAAIIAALCPNFESLRNFTRPDRAIDDALRSLQQRGYTLFFWVIEHAWKGDRRITADEIKQMRRYGAVEVFDRKVEATLRAKQLRAFISNVVLA